MTERMHQSLRTYIVAFDASNPVGGGELIYNAIRTSNIITNWWNWLPFVYLVESAAGADAISQQLQRATSGTRFLVAEVDLLNSEGVLARDAWNWIMRRQRKPEPAMPVIERANQAE